MVRKSNKPSNAMNIKLLCLAAFAGFSPAFAQTDSLPSAWTLENCIQYAQEHNITLKQKQQEEKQREVELHTSRFSWLPDLNAALNQNFDFGRSPSRTGVIADQNSANTSVSISLSMPIFDGLRTPNDIKAKKLNLQAATESLNKAREDLAVNIASYFFQVLYNRELEQVARLQVDFSAKQVEQTKALVDAGRQPLSELYNIKAQLAQDEVSLTEASNNVRLALLDLAQALELERLEAQFDVSAPEINDPIERYMSSILPPDDIYNRALAIKPQIREQELLLQSQQKQLRVAQAAYYPQLSFGASYSNGYYHYYTGDVESLPFSDQLNQNGRKTLGFTLTIPLFNRFQTRNAVRSARIAILNQQLQMDDTKKTLYKEIQQAYYNATAAQKKYQSAGKSVLAAREAFVYAENKYAAGKSTVYELNESKTQYAKSLAEEVQAKYEYVFRVKILEFYAGEELRL